MSRDNLKNWAQTFGILSSESFRCQAEIDSAFLYMSIYKFRLKECIQQISSSY